MASCCCFGCVGQTEVAILENMGKYSGLGSAGCIFLTWPFESIAGSLSLRITQLDVPVDTKTKDNVFVNVVVSIQYQVIAEQAVDAYYKLTDPQTQIRSYVNDVIRSAIPKLELDDTFTTKDHIAVACRDQLQELMQSYGYLIHQALIIDLSPDYKVKASMNEINASQRLREAARSKAEAEKILQVKAAEAEAEAKYLSGVGVARQRKAIVDGLRDSITEFAGQATGTTPQDVIDLLLLTQYFDMLRDVGQNKTQANTASITERLHAAGQNKTQANIADMMRDVGQNRTQTNTMFIPHGPVAVRDFAKQIREGFINSARANVIQR